MHEINVTAGEKVEQGNTGTPFCVTCFWLATKSSAFFSVAGNYVLTPISKSEDSQQPLCHGRGNMFCAFPGALCHISFSSLKVSSGE